MGDFILGGCKIKELGLTLLKVPQLCETFVLFKLKEASGISGLAKPTPVTEPLAFLAVPGLTSEVKSNTGQ